jgi:hypothetical protein
MARQDGRAAQTGHDITVLSREHAAVTRRPLAATVTAERGRRDSIILSFVADWYFRAAP